MLGSRSRSCQASAWRCIVGYGTCDLKYGICICRAQTASRPCSLSNRCHSGLSLNDDCLRLLKHHLRLLNERDHDDGFLASSFLFPWLIKCLLIWTVVRGTECICKFLEVFHLFPFCSCSFVLNKKETKE